MGTFDSSFSGDGRLTTAIGSGSAVAYGVAIVSDYWIVVAGSAFNGSDPVFAVVRYTRYGDLDTTFSEDGKQTTGLSTGSEFGYGVALQADGKIVVAGISNRNNSSDFAVIRWNSDGTLDTSFSGDGRLTTAVGPENDDAHGVGLQADGRIVVVGTTSHGGNYDFAVVRYNIDGTLDLSFSGDGIVTTDSGAQYDVGCGVALQPDGKIVVVGNSSNGSNAVFAVVRYDTDGTLDTSFSEDGIVTTALGSSGDYANAVALQPDGKIVVVGSSSNGSNSDFAVVRYNTDGTLDASFSEDGIVTTAIGPSYDYANSVAIQPDGRIVVAGASSYHFALARYMTDGTLDASFSGDGIVTTPVRSAFDEAYGVALQTNGKIVVAGYSSENNDEDFAVVRYNADGTLDTSFSGDGKVTTAIGVTATYVRNDRAFGVALQPDGRIVAAGYGRCAWDDFAVSRYIGDSIDMAPSVSLAGTVGVLAENTVISARTKVADIVVTDDAFGDNTLSLSGADASLFEIAGTALYLKAGAIPDYETHPRLDVTVAVDDPTVGATPDSTASLALTVTDVNEAPTGISLSGNTVPENTNTTGGYAVGILSGTDPDVSPPFNTLMFSLVGGADAAKFCVDSGNHLVLTDGVLDYEARRDANADNVYEVIVRVTDGGTPGLIYEKALAVTVLNVNDPPQLVVNKGITIVQGTAETIDRSELCVTDPDNAPSDLVFTLMTTPGHGTLRRVTAGIGAGETFTQAQVDAGLINYLHDGGASVSDSFHFMVSDGAGGWIGETAFAITITPATAPPEITVLGNGVSIADGGATPSTTDGTDFGSVRCKGRRRSAGVFTVRNDGGCDADAGDGDGADGLYLDEGYRQAAGGRGVGHVHGAVGDGDGRDEDGGDQLRQQRWRWGRWGGEPVPLHDHRYGRCAGDGGGSGVAG